MRLLAGVAGSALLVVALAACGASPPRVPSPDEMAGLPQVTVDLAPEIEAERRAVFERHDGYARLRNAVLDELSGSAVRGRLHADELRVSVSRFRLRSTGTGVWLGAMAGADMLEVTVAVIAGGETLRTFQAGAGGVAAGLVKPSADGRFNGLVRLVGERIVEQLGEPAADAMSGPRRAAGGGRQAAAKIGASGTRSAGNSGHSSVPERS